MSAVTETVGDLIDGVRDAVGLRRHGTRDQRVLLLNDSNDLDGRPEVDVETCVEPILAHGAEDIIAFMVDLDGLQVAYLGVALAHYLDVETGDIVDLPLEAPPPGEATRFRRIPTRTPESEAEDRRLFVEKLDFSVMREHLARAVGDAGEFRRVLSEDRRVERSFFNFKNDQATRAIELWLAEEGLA